MKEINKRKRLLGEGNKKYNGKKEQLNGRRERKCSNKTKGKNRNLNRGSEGENCKMKIKMERR